MPVDLAALASKLPILIPDTMGYKSHGVHLVGKSIREDLMIYMSTTTQSTKKFITSILKLCMRWSMESIYRPWSSRHDINSDRIVSYCR